MSGPNNKLDRCEIHRSKYLRGRTWEISQACSIRLAKLEELSGESTADALTVTGKRRIVVELGLIATKPSFVLLGDSHGFTIDFGTICDSQHMQIAISLLLLLLSSSPGGLNNWAEIKRLLNCFLRSKLEDGEERRRNVLETTGLCLLAHKLHRAGSVFRSVRHLTGGKIPVDATNDYY